MTNPKYTLQILRDDYLKSIDPKFEMKKYNLRSYEYKDKSVIVFSTNKKEKMKIYIDLLGIKTDFKYQKTMIAEYLFYD